MFVPDLPSDPATIEIDTQQATSFDEIKAAIVETKEPYIHPHRRGIISSNVHDTYHPTHESQKEFLGSPKVITPYIPKGDPGEYPYDDDDDGDRRKQFDATEGRSSDRRTPGKEEFRNDEVRDYEKRGLGINGMIEAFSSKEALSGAWDSDPDNSKNIF